MNAIDFRDAMPSPRADDDAEVRAALAAASAHWAAGEGDDALRSLRRAAEIANDREHDHRAVELFKVAATLRSSLAPPAPASAPIPPPSHDSSTRRPLPPRPPQAPRLAAVPRALPPPPRSTHARNVAPSAPAAPLTAALPAVRVAVMRSGATGLRITTLAAGEMPPANAVVALLVATSKAEADAMMALLSPP